MWRWFYLGALVAMLVGLGSACGTMSAAKDRTVPLSRVVIDNTVADCVSLVPLESTTSGNLALLWVRATARKSVAACGCSSSLLSYSVVDGRADAHTAPGDPAGRVYGVLSSSSLGRASRPFALVLSTDNRVRPAGRSILRVQCKAPD